jgi:hypothetical protein
VEPLSTAWYIAGSVALVCFFLLFLGSFTVLWPKWLRVITRILGLLGVARISLALLLAGHSVSPGIYRVINAFIIGCRVSIPGLGLVFLIGGARHGGFGKWLDRRRAPKKHESE